MRTTIVALIIAILAFAPIFSINAEEGVTKTQTSTNTPVQELISYITKQNKGKEPLLWERELPDPKDKYSSEFYQAVVLFKGERITVCYFPPNTDGRLSFVSFWWRKNGTAGNSTMWTSAVGLDGITHGGSDPEDKKNSSLDPDRPIERQVGVEFRQYWQGECNRIIQSLLNYYRGTK